MKSQLIVSCRIADNRSVAQSGNASQMSVIKGEESPGAPTKISGKSNKMSTDESERCIGGFIDLFANLCPAETFDVRDTTGTQSPVNLSLVHERSAPRNEKNPELMQAQAFQPATDLRQVLNSTSLWEAQAERSTSGTDWTDGKSGVSGKDIVDPIALPTSNALSVTQKPRTLIENQMDFQRPGAGEILESKDAAKGQPVQTTFAEKESPVISGPETQKKIGQLPEFPNMKPPTHATESPIAFTTAGTSTALKKTEVYPSGESAPAGNNILADGSKSLKTKEFNQKLSTVEKITPLLARQLEDFGQSRSESVELLEPNALESNQTAFSKDNSKFYGTENLNNVYLESDTQFYPKNNIFDLKTAPFDDPGFFEYKNLSNDLPIEDSASPSKGDFALVQLDTEKPITTIRQIVQKMTMYASNGQNRMQIQLKPEMFGGLKIDILSENQQVAIRMTAESTAVKEILEQNLHLLKNELSQHGLEIIKFDVLIQNNSDSLNNSQQFASFSTPQRQNQNKARAQLADLDEDGNSNEFAKSAIDARNEIEKTNGIDFFA